MRSFLCVDFLICSIVLIAALAGFSEAELEQIKNRRGGGGTSGLFAFPRVGRRDPSLNNNLHDTASYDGIYPVEVEEYEEYPKSGIKRSDLIAFPRIGRNDEEIRKLAHLLALQQALDKRTGPSATSGLWFGPRLGKRSIQAKAHSHDGGTAHVHQQDDGHKTASGHF